MSVHGPPRLYFEPLKLLNLGFFNADLDPAFHFNADPDPVFHLNADPGPAPLQSDGNLRPLVYRPFRALFSASRPPL